MIVVAGPPGAGKSTAFPVSEFGVDYFNADDLAAELNHGSYRSIPPSIRSTVHQQFRRFVQVHIKSLRSFAVETTLRTPITFDQARLARKRGFETIMFFIGLGSSREAIRRIRIRADAGGHAATAGTLRDIYRSSMDNLPKASSCFDHLFVFDNGRFDSPPRLVLEANRGESRFLPGRPPLWLKRALLQSAPGGRSSPEP